MKSRHTYTAVQREAGAHLWEPAPWVLPYAIEVEPRGQAGALLEIAGRRCAPLAIALTRQQCGQLAARLRSIATAR